MNTQCPLCKRWLHDVPIFVVGAVKFCSEEHAVEFKLGNMSKATA